jgi:hypothetical protein
LDFLLETEQLGEVFRAESSHVIVLEIFGAHFINVLANLVADLVLRAGTGSSPIAPEPNNIHGSLRSSNVEYAAGIFGRFTFRLGTLDFHIARRRSCSVRILHERAVTDNALEVNDADFYARVVGAETEGVPVVEGVGGKNFSLEDNSRRPGRHARPKKAG